jgi:ribosomal protein S11
VYRLVEPYAARSAAPRAQSAAVAIASLIREAAIVVAPGGNGSQDALEKLLRV